MLRIKGHRGFSLIELLVVIVIVGIVTSIALLSLGLLGNDRDLQTEARRLISLIEVAQDEAMMQGREFGVELMAGGYRFVEYDPFTNEWTELIGDDTFRLRQLPEDVEFDLFLEEKRIVLTTDPAEFKSADENNSFGPTPDYAPHILIFSSGEHTPFEVTIVRMGTDQAIMVESTPEGILEIVSDDDLSRMRR